MPSEETKPKPTLAERLREDLAAYLERTTRTPSTVPRGVVYISEMGHPCAWYLWARWSIPRPRRTPDAEQRMAHSTAMGEVLKRRLMDAGYMVLHCEEAVSMPVAGIELRGRMDARIGTTPRGALAAELKCYEHAESLTSLEAYLQGRHWHYKVPAQILGYLQAKKEGTGLLITMEKSSGDIRILEVTLERHAWMLDTAFAVIGLLGKALETDTPPPTLREVDPEFCGDCDFRDHCPLIARSAPSTLAAPTIRLPSVKADMAAHTMVEYEKQGRMYNQAKATLKDILKASGAAPEGSHTGRVVVLGTSVVTIDSRGRMTVTLAETKGGE